MSTIDDSLVDALRFVDQCRKALDRRDLPSALLYYGSAERFCGLAIGMMGAYRAFGVPTPNADEVQDKIAALRAVFLAPKQAPLAPIPDVHAVVNEGLAPLLRELATPNADPEAVVRARAANATAALYGAFDIRKRPE